MKKFIIGTCVVILLLFGVYAAYYYLGFYIVDFREEEPVSTFMKTEGTSILMERDGEYIPFEIRGMDLGVGIPGHWATDYAVDQETYLRWFQEIQDMGANTIRVYINLHDDFYNAFYKYNTERERKGEEPLWLIHGVWVNDYIMNSRRDAYDPELLDVLLDDCKTMVDIIHGSRAVSLGRGTGSGFYNKDISSWVIGYIVGIEWESSLVAYTNQNCGERNCYTGEYLYTSPDATPFEAFLCRVGDTLIAYESSRYREQRLLAFSNWPTTDPFAYPAIVTLRREKVVTINVEHILQTEAFQSGQFASYHIYAYFPDYLEMMRVADQYDEAELKWRMGEVIKENLEYRTSLLNAPYIRDYLKPDDYYDRQGRYNTYIAYLRAITSFHTIPVVISEYGIPTSRGMAQRDANTGRNQGRMSEREQGRALIECYEDIMDAGCAGSCLFSWQDEWFKRTWNTMHAVDLSATPYWSDFQTNEQNFGILSFDPGEERCVCYVDGDDEEWSGGDLTISGDGADVSVKYDEKFLYFLVRRDGLRPELDTLYIPIDTTQKSGSTYCENYGIAFERACDFLIVLHGKGDSRIVVQKRYEALLSTYAKQFYPYDPYMDPPDVDTPYFERIYLPLITENILPEPGKASQNGTRYETGVLRHGNGNPDAEDFDSLTDFCFGEGFVEIRIPWQLLNFSDPSNMMIHDDYYEHYGIENLHIDELYVGIGSKDGPVHRISMAAVPLEGWGKHPAAHERLKRSYYILRDYWAKLDAERAQTAAG